MTVSHGHYCYSQVFDGETYKLAIEKIKCAGIKISSKNSREIRIPVYVAAIILPVRTSPTNGRNTIILNSAIMLENVSEESTFDVHASIAVFQCPITNGKNIVHSDT